MPLLRLSPDTALGPDGVWLGNHRGGGRRMWVPWESVESITLHRRALHWELRARLVPPHTPAVRTANLWVVDRSVEEVREAVERYAGGRGPA